MAETSSSIIEMVRVGASFVVTPKESLTSKNAEEFEKAMKNLITHQQAQVILDGKSVAFLDSRALEAILRVSEWFTERGGTLKIAGLNPVCRDILVATRLINVLRTYQDVAEAVRSGQA